MMKQKNSLHKSKESKLNQYFDELRNENFEDTFRATENWLKTADAKLQTKSERKFFKMKNYFLANKFRLAYTFLILAFTIAACNYPVTQQESAGDVLQWTVSSDNKDAINKIENLDWFKKGDYNINEDNANGQSYKMYSIVIPKESHSQVSDFEKQLNAIPGILQIKISPLNETVKRPVYSALLNDLFKIDINASNMSDAELSNEIDKQLKSAGIENANIDFQKDQNGNRRVRVAIPVGQVKKDGGFDMTIKDGDNVTKLKEVRKKGPGDPDKFKGKTDEEIRNMVRTDLNMPELKDDQIEIIRKDDNVMVKVAKSVEKSGKMEEDKLEIQQELK